MAKRGQPVVRHARRAAEIAPRASRQEAHRGAGRDGRDERGAGIFIRNVFNALKFFLQCRAEQDVAGKFSGSLTW